MVGAQQPSAQRSGAAGGGARASRASLGARGEAPIERIDAAAYSIPTDHTEADGTFAWNATTLVVVNVQAGGERGLGYTYGDASLAVLVRDTLARLVLGRDAFAVQAAWQAMVDGVRNVGRPGIAAMAIGAVDAALWDVKAKVAGLPLTRLLGAVRDAAPAYGSGGFTSDSLERLRTQLGEWAAGGFRAVKMKVGSDPGADVERVLAARHAIGAEAELFVDANGAYRCKQALALAEQFAAHGVTWFEEPVSSDDLESLRLLRDRAPAGMEIAAGEYGYDAFYFRRMLAAGAIDVLQVDATRCAGITGFLRAAALADAWSTPVSSHTAPALHVHVMCAIPRIRPLEYFHDHARIEHMLFDGAPLPNDGMLAPDATRPGLGLDLKRADAERYALG